MGKEVCLLLQLRVQRKICKLLTQNIRGVNSGYQVDFGICVLVRFKIGYYVHIDLKYFLRSEILATDGDMSVASIMEQKKYFKYWNI